MKKSIFLAALMLSGCGTQHSADASERACIDGVQYIVIDPGSSAQAMSPHLQQDGKPYLCDAPK